MVSLHTLLLCLLLFSFAASTPLTSEEKLFLKGGSLEKKAGWFNLKISGKPYARGFQHGHFLAENFVDALNTTKYMTYQTMGMEYQFFVDKAVELHKSKIPSELLEEMKGIADGISKSPNGIPQTVDDIIGWNAYLEMTGYWWPSVQHQYGFATVPATSMAKARCSAFIATGSATKDGKIVCGHETFAEFWNGQYANVMIDITPESGSRMVFQCTAGFIASMTDFFITSAGLIVTETTIAGFMGYDEYGTPEYTRIREATQYAKSLSHWVSIMKSGDNGGYANSWLIGDINTNEIARFEQGLKYETLDKKKDGYYFGDNAAFDPRIRNLECDDTGFSDIRQQTGARRTRWPQMLNANKGKIDMQIGQTMLGDTYDVYLNKNVASSRTICSHYDEDPQPYVSDPAAVWNVPFIPCGSTDGKVATDNSTRNMELTAIFGRADGKSFDVNQFLKKHPQWNWQEGYLKSRPSQPWASFP